MRHKVWGNCHKHCILKYFLQRRAIFVPNLLPEMSNKWMCRRYLISRPEPTNRWTAVAHPRLHIYTHTSSIYTLLLRRLFSPLFRRGEEPRRKKGKKYPIQNKMWRTFILRRTHVTSWEQVLRIRTSGFSEITLLVK